MIRGPAFAGKSYVVYGLARSGLAAVDALLASGASVMAWDEKEEARAALSPSPLQGRGPGRGGKAEAAQTPPLSTLSPEGERALRIADPLTTSLYGYAGIVVSPGVPLNRHP